MKQTYREQPPTDEQHGVRYRSRAAVDNQVNDQQKSEKRSDDQPRGDGSIPYGSPIRSKATKERDGGSYPASCINCCRLRQLKVAGYAA